MSQQNSGWLPNFRNFLRKDWVWFTTVASLNPASGLPLSSAREAWSQRMICQSFLWKCSEPPRKEFHSSSHLHRSDYGVKIFPFRSNISTGSLTLVRSGSTRRTVLFIPRSHSSMDNLSAMTSKFELNLQVTCPVSPYKLPTTFNSKRHSAQMLSKPSSFLSAKHSPTETSENNSALPRSWFQIEMILL